MTSKKRNHSRSRSRSHSPKSDPETALFDEFAKRLEGYRLLEDNEMPQVRNGNYLKFIDSREEPPRLQGGLVLANHWPEKLLIKSGRLVRNLIDLAEYLFWGKANVSLEEEANNVQQKRQQIQRQNQLLQEAHDEDRILVARSPEEKQLIMKLYKFFKSGKIREIKKLMVDNPNPKK